MPEGGTDEKKKQKRVIEKNKKTFKLKFATGDSKVKTNLMIVNSIIEIKNLHQQRNTFTN